MYKGPTIQSDLFLIILKFRCFKYVLTADIAKICRQILIHEEQTCLQTILWRENSCEPIQSYELITLTYGTKPASFIATKCVQQLAEYEKEYFPIAVKVALTDFYTDDLLTGANTKKEILQLKEQMIKLLKKGGFDLHKWHSNIIEDEEDVSGQKDFIEFEKG